MNAALHPLELPLVVGVTSHRNLAASELEPIRQRVRDFFVQLKQDFPDLPLVVLSALAEGGDQLVAREALATGARLIAPLPLSPQSYADDFIDAPSRAAFTDLCQRADVLQMPLLPGSTLADIAVQGEARDRQYAQAGVFIASHSHIMLALWDGRESDLLGGTAQVVRYALDGVMPGLIEHRPGAYPVLDSIDESLGYNRGILSIKFTNFRDTATSYTVVANANHANTNDMTFTYSGELIAPGGNRKFTLKLTRGSPPNSWLVDDFQPN